MARAITYGIYDAHTGELIEGGFFNRGAADDAAGEYRGDGRAVKVQRQDTDAEVA